MYSASLILVCYLIGSIPFGLIIVKIVQNVDLRSYGSGNTGMTNVLRTTGPIPAIIVLILDCGKGALAVLLAESLISSPQIEVMAALSALTGHNWSIFLKFKGGKGTATGLGALCAISPLAAGAVLCICAPIIVISRYMSLASIIGSGSAFIVLCVFSVYNQDPTWGVTSPIYILYATIGTPMIIFKHKENITRLLNGQEMKIGHSMQNPSSRVNNTDDEVR